MPKKSKEMDNNVDILDLLLDDTYEDPIFLFDEQNNKIAFEKVAIINLDGNLFFLLSPLDVIDGIEADEALVFKVVEDFEGKHYLIVEDDEEIAVKVFDEYYRLLGELD